MTFRSAPINVIASLAFFGIPALADIVSVSPDALDFGNQVLTTSAVKSVVLENPTKKILQIFSITATGDFSSPGNTCGTTVLPDSRCTISVQFAPTALGARSGVLNVSDDANDGTQKVKLSGTGVPVALLSIGMSPTNPSIPLGRKQQFTATGNYNNGTSQDLTASSAWSSSAPGVASVSPTGLASSVGQGVATITALSGGVSGSTALTVTAPVLVSLAVTPVSPSVAVGATQQFTATGTRSDGTTGDFTASVDWTSSIVSIAGISLGGLATGNSLGFATISATSGSVTASTSLEVGGTFTAINGSMSPRWLHTATLLNNGRVLVVGGLGTASLCCGSLATSQLYDPATRSFGSSGAMASARARHTATLLSNGKVLIAGGDAGIPLASAELYDPATGSFSPTGGLASPRTGHTATLLENGKVLIAGGSDSAGAELYDPATGFFTTTGSIATLRFDHTATLLNDGKVLLTGGSNLASAELYDPVTGTFTTVGNMTIPRSHHRATLLNDGTVLVTGRSNSSCCVAGTDLYDPGAGAFTATGAMISGRNGHTATLLTNGQVLVTGGQDFTGPLSSAERYDPIPRTFAVTGDMDVEHAMGSRVGHTATRLNTGEVLVGGGTDGVTVNSTAETYQPSTLAPPGLTSIAVTPGSASISVGSTQRFIALGTFSGGSTQALASVVWTSSDPAVAGTSNDAGSHGIAIGRQAGTATVRASTGPISESATLTVQ